MNPISQVLSDLKKRGANMLSGESSIRVVQVQKNRLRVVWIIASVLIVMFALVGWWNLRHKAATPAAEGLQQSSGAVSPVAGENVAQPTQSIAVPQAASQPVAVATQDAHQDESKQKADVPNPELGRESSAIPPLQNLHTKPVVAATGQSHSHTAALPAPAKKNKKQTTVLTPVSVSGDSVDKQADAQQAELSTESRMAATVSMPASAQEGSVDKRVRQVSVQQQAENEFRRANGLMQQGHTDEALAGYAAALQLDAGHEIARQIMVGLLLENKRNTDAERVLEDGLRRNPKHSVFAMLLARLQIDRGVPWVALVTLQKTLPYAERQADYQAFIAALLQRLDRHKEAIRHYQVALQLSPNSGLWLMGLGISLQAEQRKEDARDIFRRAAESKTLSAELQTFVSQRLKEL